MATLHPLGRKVPPTDDHVRKYPLRAALPPTLLPFVVNRTLRLPSLRREYDQGSEGACVGYGLTWAMSILNGKRYVPRWLYLQAQLIDPWRDTPPGEGTDVNSGCKILRDKGHVITRYGKASPEPVLDEGVSEYRWAVTVDEMRWCIANGIPVVIGVNWYSNFDSPQKDASGRYWIGKEGTALGTIRGGHCVCLYGAYDSLQAFKGVNNWGMSYPLFHLPYSTADRLRQEDGEVTVITDRPNAPPLAPAA